MGGMTSALEDTVVWHDVECGAYDADLPLWRSLAEQADAVLEIGAGTGRVALHLAERGCGVTALDPEPALVRAMAARARERGLRVRAHVGDARSFDLQRSFDLVIAPMQVVQLMGGEGGRLAMLERVRRHLKRGGVFAAALADPFEGIPPEDAEPPVPDMREHGGWVYSSTPVAVRDAGDATEIERLRQAVSPSGELSESLSTTSLDRVSPTDLERPAAGLGFRAHPTRAVPATGDYVGSTVVLLEAT
jgi:SAM-dependent methyltransferase